MKRPYTDGKSDTVDFFIGTEVEHTPAFGKKTLFVVGVHDNDAIQLLLNDPYTSIGAKLEHIYFGANQSFPQLAADDAAAWGNWAQMIQPFLAAGYLCTLDIDVSCVPGLLETGLTESCNFIPMISVKLPYIQQLGYNATIKLDDQDFNYSNPGVWCHSVHELQNRSKFTDWSKYTKDEIIK